MASLAVRARNFPSGFYDPSRKCTSLFGRLSHSAHFGMASSQLTTADMIFSDFPSLYSAFNTLLFFFPFFISFTLGICSDKVRRFSDKAQSHARYDSTTTHIKTCDKKIHLRSTQLETQKTTKKNRMGVWPGGPPLGEIPAIDRMGTIDIHLFINLISSLIHAHIRSTNIPRRMPKYFLSIAQKNRFSPSQVRRARICFFFCWWQTQSCEGPAPSSPARYGALQRIACRFSPCSFGGQCLNDA